MAQGSPVGTMFVELSLDATKYTAGQKRILAEAQKNSADINRVFSILGTKTDEMFNATRLQAQNAYNAIAKSAKSSADEIRRAHEGLTKTLSKLDEEQFGKRTSMLETFKKNWLAATAAIAAATGAGIKIWNMAKVGAGFDEQLGMLDNLAQKYKTTADTIISEMDRASKEQIAKSDLMSVALAGIAKGLTPEQLINLANAAETLGDAVGKTATEALKDLTEALETGRVKGLKNYLGAALDLEATFGDLVNKMTAAEKAQAMYNMTMLAAIDIQSRQNKELDDAADKIAQIEKRYDDAMLAASRFFKTVVVGMLDIGAASKSPKGSAYTFMPGMPERPSSDYAPGPGWSTGKTKFDAEIQAMKETLKLRADTGKKEKELADEREKWLSDYLKGVDKAWRAEVERNEGIGELAMVEMKWADEKFEKEKKYAEEIAKKQIEEQQKALAKLESDWRHFWENVQDFTADTFYDLFTNLDDGWQNLLDRMKQWFLKWVSEIAAKQVVIQLQGVLGGGTTSTGGGILSQILSLGGTAGSGSSMFGSGSNIIGSIGLNFGASSGAIGSGVVPATGLYGGYEGAMFGSAATTGGTSSAAAGAGAVGGFALIALSAFMIGNALYNKNKNKNRGMYATALEDAFVGDTWQSGVGLPTGEYPAIWEGNWWAESAKTFVDAKNKVIQAFNEGVKTLIQKVPNDIGKMIDQYLATQNWSTADITTTGHFMGQIGEKEMATTLQTLITRIGQRYDEIINGIFQGRTQEILTLLGEKDVLTAQLTPMWGDFVMGLKTSDLAPVQSLETFSFYYGKLMDAVTADPKNADKINKLLQYTSGTYLPFVKGYTEGGGDYASIFNTIVGSKGDLYGTVFSSITSIDKKLDDFFEDVREYLKNPISVAVNIDGKEVANAVATAVGNGNVPGWNEFAPIPPPQGWPGGP